MDTGPVINEEIPRVKRSRWADYLFRPVLITVMIMCFNISLVNLARLFNPGWNGNFFLLAMLLTTVEAIYSFRVLKLERARGIPVLQFRLAEWAVLLVLLRLLNFAGSPPNAIWAELQFIWQHPLAGLFTVEYLMQLTLAFLAWLLATYTMTDFDDLYDPWLFRTNNTLPLDDLAARFFMGGIILVIVSGIAYWVARAGVSSLTDFQRPSAGGIVLNVLVYFTLGLVLLSQARLTTLLVRWHVQKITVSPGLVKQWAKYGLTFLGVVMAVVFLLPTGYTMGFLTSAGIVIAYVLGVLIFLIRLLIFLIQLPLFLLLSLLGGTPPEAVPPPSLPPPDMSPPPAAESLLPPWVQAVQSLVFWLVAIAILWYMVKIYLGDHPELAELLKGFKPIGALVRLWQAVWRRLLGLAKFGLERLPKALPVSRPAAAGPPAPRGWNWFGLKRLSPRQRILAYYLNTLERAAQYGLPRKSHQTPFEYEPELGRTASQARPEVAALTRAFVKARYSQANFDDAHANRAKQLWQQIRRALRNRSRKIPPLNGDP